MSKENKDCLKSYYQSEFKWRNSVWYHYLKSVDELKNKLNQKKDE